LDKKDATGSAEPVTSNCRSPARCRDTAQTQRFSSIQFGF